MTYEEVCKTIVKAQYGLQSIYEDHPKETKTRLKEENEYYKSVIDYYKSLAWKAIKDNENVSI